MPTTYFEAHPKMQRAIKAVVTLLDRGEQPPAELDVLPAIDFDYAEYEMAGETLGELVLTPKGMEAAARWRTAMSRGGDTKHRN